MMNRRIDNTKNLIYEAEGLLELITLRPEKEGELSPLISQKLRAAAEAFEVSEVFKPAESFSAPGADNVASLPSFCINDKFRFRRALFGGSQEAFNDAVSRTAGFGSYAEAENFYIHEAGIDPETEEGSDFLTVIKNHFGK